MIYKTMARGSVLVIFLANPDGELGDFIGEKIKWRDQERNSIVQYYYAAEISKWKLINGDQVLVFRGRESITAGKRCSYDLEGK